MAYIYAAGAGITDTFHTQLVVSEDIDYFYDLIKS